MKIQFRVSILEGVLAGCLLMRAVALVSGRKLLYAEASCVALSQRKRPISQRQELAKGIEVGAVLVVTNSMLEPSRFELAGTWALN